MQSISDGKQNFVTPLPKKRIVLVLSDLPEKVSACIYDAIDSRSSGHLRFKL